MASPAGHFTATGSSTTIYGSDVDLLVGGTFVGTVVLEVSLPGVGGADIWAPVGSLVAPGIVHFSMATQHKWRCTCSAYTSGNAYYELTTAVNLNLTPLTG